LADLPIIQYRTSRLEKLEGLRELGLEPYPSKSHRTAYASHLQRDFASMEDKEVVVAGRIMSWRPQGKVTFAHLQDQSGSIQLFIRPTSLADTNGGRNMLGYPHLKLLDLGDFIEVRGILTKTKTGEISVAATELRFLAKSLRPLPDKWHGLKNREAILRRRYLDTTMNPDHKAPFEVISRMALSIRKFLDGEGFLEFQTPIIQAQYGGGLAKPFTTYVNALGQRMYLAISHELYLKRLIAAGFDKVFTIGRYFRNEGIDRTHQPEFSMLETMVAYENYEYSMDLVERLFRHVAVDVFAKTEFTIGGHQVEFGVPWARVSMVDAVRTVTGIDFGSVTSLEEANAALHSLGSTEPQASVGLCLAKAFEIRVESTLIQPTLLYGHPVEISPLAKPMHDNSRYAERFEIFIGGMECGDNWSEQNDPIQLLETWKETLHTRASILGDYHPLDYDFIETLEYGMPPTTGIGPGIERMAMLFTGQDNIDNVVFFPMIRPQLSKENRAIFEISSDETFEATEATANDEMILGFDDFESLVKGDLLQPARDVLTLEAHLSIWPLQDAPPSFRATGLIGIHGFNEAIKVICYTARVEGRIDPDGEILKFKELTEMGMMALLSEKFKGRRVEWSANHSIRVLSAGKSVH
jgi:lysyl-tRNA synthetase class 2